MVGLSAFLGFYLFGLSSCIPSIDFAMQEVANCPLAVERLGEPIQQDWWPGYGSTRELRELGRNAMGAARQGF